MPVCLTQSLLLEMGPLSIFTPALSTPQERDGN